MEQRQLSDAIYRALAKATYLVAALLILAAFMDAIFVIVPFFLMAVIFAIGLSPAVNWLEERKLPRAVAAIGVLLSIGVVAAGIIAIVVPQVAKESQHFYENVNQYGQQLSARLETLVGKYPVIEEQLNNPKLKENLTASLAAGAGRLGRISLTAVTVVLGVLVLITVVAYLLVRPRPLLKALVMVFPPKLRDNFVTAYVEGAKGVVNWVWANALIGAIEGVATAAFLAAMQIPGAIIWGAVTFFAELIPQLGSYLMAVPPLLITIAVAPEKAIWVLLWFIALQQAVNHIVAPIIRSSAMNIHPVSEIFAVLALSMAFGVLGAVIASPVVVFTKAFYDAFYTSKQAPDDQIDDRVEDMLARRLADKPPDVGDIAS